MTILELAAVAAAASLVLGVLLLILYMVLTRQSRQMRKDAIAGADASMRQDVRRLMDELGHLAEQIDLRMDARIQELQEAMGRAEKTLQRLGSEGISDYRPIRDPAHGEILRLDGQGLDSLEIARRMEMDVGEVELVLNLNRSGRDGR